MTAIYRPRPCVSGICLTEFLLLKHGILAGAGLRFRAAIGRAGRSAEKHEGDGATPVGLLRLTRVLYRAGHVRPPRCAVPIEPIAPDDGWCDDPLDPLYNRMVKTPYFGRHEPLWRTDSLYDIIGVLDWNLRPIVPHRGSAIFLHVATAGYEPTAGCIALSMPDLCACLEAGLTAIQVLP
jgi:L,D-peptidoglycan transpeptidase YkuD (ErfK/YbiS/YcfS/YnhG family)